MEHVLPMLTQQATAARDREAARLQQARQSHAQAQATLQRLEAFRQECLARSPAATGGRGDGATLAAYQQFVARLDEAIAMQRQETGLRANQADAQQQRLAQAQQRLLAFQALANRQAVRAAQRETKREQRMADEFAARATARAQEPFA
ncbi:flagellar export protein FliJ [Ramlibacter humi]|uniref:Flagellar FliJ protein n=1 Tax=Ramlibacter humi TaxID=2530451 RepID=A0A4Z0CBS4_9BURK|nr:flagellar export protein FliJ [Ramlibacter humi]TFZ08342.1 flagellar export protein FliJ [Ramlibacter humi]